MKRSTSKKPGKSRRSVPSSKIKARSLPIIKSFSAGEIAALNREQLRSITQFMREEGLQSFTYRSKDFEIDLKFAGAVSASHPPTTAPVNPQGHLHSRSIESPAAFSVSSPQPEPSMVSSAANSRMIKSPFVGTFYRAPAPGKPPFIEVGSQVSAGDPLCVLEAMKLMNEIEAEFRCKILKILVEDGSPVEFGESLFEVQAL